MAGVGFVHLHVHSSFSLLEGALSIAKLAELAKADKQPALALTDTGNLFGALEFSEKMAGAGIQPIVGLSLAVEFADATSRGRPQGGLPARRSRIVCLAAREDGYRNLMALTSRAYLEAPSGEEPHVPVARLADHSAGLIVLTGGPDGPIDRAAAEGQPDLAGNRLETLVDLFGNRLYVEMQRHGADREREVEPALLDLAFRLGLPLVATNEPFFAKADDYEAHDALICIAEGRLIADAERRQLTPEHRFKTRAEMAALFADLPEAVAASVEIARRCAVRPRTRKPILPHFTTGDGAAADPSAAEEAELRRQAAEGLDRRLKTQGLAPGLTEDDYRQRLVFELDVIARMKFPGYFLIVADFIKWAKNQGIPVGPGRGSGAGSLVAYSLTITDLDPIRFGLLFERFLNPERVSMPDFDVDFCQDRRDEVIRYVQERYGRDQVAQIITFGTLLARGVLRDVGRVLQMPYGQVDKLCKLVPQNPAKPVTLQQAITEEPKLQAARDAEPIVKRLLDIALRLEGLYRHASTHAAGIVIGDRPLMELVPLYRDPKSDMPVTQFNMKWVEPAGLVKFDFLGLKTLTTLQTAVKLIRRCGIEIDLTHIPLDDRKTYETLARGETAGVFQLESAGMRKALIDMEPDRFEDIIALVALYRPGPMANIPTYCARKHGREQPEYPHPSIEPVLKETFGVIIYQEQVMQIAQILAGYSLGEADLLRRAMGKKIRAEMDKQRARFVDGATERGVDKAQAETIFDLLAKFADYGFNKSHAAAYALVAYQTAYLKANFPVEFLAASMTLDMSNTDKLAEFRAEAERLGIKIVPPDLNRSGAEFEPDGRSIVYALAAIKGVGRQAVDSLVAARAAAPFRDLQDLAERIDPKAVNKRTFECLAAAGACDRLERSRARAVAAADVVLAHAARRLDDRIAGQSELFGGAAAAPLAVPLVPDWLPSDRLKREFDAIGFFLSGHPLDDYAATLKRLRVQAWTEFCEAVKEDGATAGRLAAIVVGRTEKRTKTGNKMGILALSDPSAPFEAVIFSEGLQQYGALLEEGARVVLQVSAEVQGEDVRARIQGVEALDEVAARHQRGLNVFMREAGPLDSLARRLEAGGDGEVAVVLVLDGGRTEVEVRLPGRYKVSPQIAGAIKAIPGVMTVEDA
ncbi:DNA polymerase III subunit alpha [Blastochloris viridis]|uniref:DNA polymerase III subunit alpha n=1 Tax=Blastochloris viridis TaxID=1079 RepID=A0A0H5BC76_BLAVI|nr:DNA polymerase III subunit alpha [Blastochloris viridis]ALK10206.1 DNA polymerase III subunit alpha [Blastochloris viridis]BAR99862.1 DNA polymerase III alpha subunit [Blastochloris viridis]CUU42870.1 DNA polymerase III subunit alpha [Blastochloris viridis]